MGSRSAALAFPTLGPLHPSEDRSLYFSSLGLPGPRASLGTANPSQPLRTRDVYVAQGLPSRPQKEHGARARTCRGGASGGGAGSWDSRRLGGR